MNQYNLIPSSDDDSDLILEAYYHGYSKKDWINFKKLPKLPQSLDLRNPKIKPINNPDISLGSSISLIKEWIELRETQQLNIFSPESIYKYQSLEHPDLEDNNSDICARDALKNLKKYGILRKVDLKEEDNVQQMRASIFKIKNYCRIYSIECLKRSLVDNSPALMIFPIFNNTETFWKPFGNVLGGRAVVVIGYNQDGFIITNFQKDSKNQYIIFPYEDWGIQWEVWTIFNYDLINNDYNIEEVLQQRSTTNNKRLSSWSIKKNQRQIKKNRRKEIRIQKKQNRAIKRQIRKRSNKITQFPIISPRKDNININQHIEKYKTVYEKDKKKVEIESDLYQTDSEVSYV